MSVVKIKFEFIIVSVSPWDVTEIWLLLVCINALLLFTGIGFITGWEIVNVPVDVFITINQF